MPLNARSGWLHSFVWKMVHAWQFYGSNDTCHLSTTPGIGCFICWKLLMELDIVRSPANICSWLYGGRKVIEEAADDDWASDSIGNNSTMGLLISDIHNHFPLLDVWLQPLGYFRFHAYWLQFYRGTLILYSVKYCLIHNLSHLTSTI